MISSSRSSSEGGSHRHQVRHACVTRPCPLRTAAVDDKSVPLQFFCVAVQGALRRRSRRQNALRAATTAARRLRPGAARLGRGFAPAAARRSPCCGRCGRASRPGILAAAPRPGFQGLHGRGLNDVQGEVEPAHAERPVSTAPSRPNSWRKKCSTSARDSFVRSRPIPFAEHSAKMRGPPARTLKFGKPGWRPRSASAVVKWQLPLNTESSKVSDFLSLPFLRPSRFEVE
jgi:hypothetical protein